MVQQFTSHLKVDKQIVSLLSKSTYQHSFSYAIRELVSNAYDADALLVNITIDDKLETIIIKDDGNGMTRDEFEGYLYIAGSKSKDYLTRKYKRRRIGQFGVGFLSIFPFCESLEITTTTQNSDEVLNALIPTGAFFQSNNTEEVQEIPISCTITTNSRERSLHYTQIRLNKPSYLVKQYFSTITTKKRDSIFTWDSFKRFQWELQEDLPLSYPPDSSYFDDQTLKYDESIGIKVLLNGLPIFRHILGNNILESGTIIISNVECKYIFATDFKSIKPLEARGIKIRVNNVGIGKREDFNLKRDRGFSRLHWVSGEIHLSDNTKEHITLSRDAFIANPTIDNIYEIFADKLRKAAYTVEDIAVAEKDIIKLQRKGRNEFDGTKKKIIESSILKLRSKGFRVEYIEGQNVLQNIEIDKDEKIIRMDTSVHLYEDSVNILGRTYQILYNSWDVNYSDPACRILEDNVIELNQEYPLFKSKTYGSLFKKLHILLSVTRSSKTTEEMYQTLANNLLSEFRDFI